MPKVIPDLPVLQDPTEPKVPRAPGDCKVSRAPKETKAIQAKLGRLAPRVIPEKLAHKERQDSRVPRGTKGIRETRSRGTISPQPRKPV